MGLLRKHVNSKKKMCLDLKYPLRSKIFGFLKLALLNMYLFQLPY